MTKTSLVVPTLHMNGTSKQDLTEQYKSAYEALDKAMQALPRPHGCDYYVQGDGVIQQAVKQADTMFNALEAVQDQLLEIYRAIAAQGKKD